MKKLAIVGATGLVGQTVLKVLQEQNMLEQFELFLIVSNHSAGKVLVFNNNHYRLIELNDSVFKFCLDYAIFVTNEDVSRVWVKKFVKHDIVVIDNSSAFRLDNDIPLIVPEINFHLEKDNKIISNPNCSTIQLVLVLDRLITISKFETIVVSSYQSVSGAGKEALIDLKNDTKNIFKMGIKDNIIPQIGSLIENKNCSEENKIIFETQKILGEKLNIIATAVRVPISYCHGESVYVKFTNKIDIQEIIKSLNKEYIKVSDDLIYPVDAVGTDLTYVFRLRQVSDKEIVFFIMADNLRRGAAYNAVEILKKLELMSK